MVRPTRLSPLGFADDAKPICFVNGKRYTLPMGRGEATLLQWLRGELALHLRECAAAGSVLYTQSLYMRVSSLTYSAQSLSGVTRAPMHLSNAGASACTQLF
jgi:hypothetical protein